MFRPAFLCCAPIDPLQTDSGSQLSKSEISDLATQDVHFADNKAASADNSTGMGGALYVSPDCSGGFTCKNVSANVTAFSMLGNAAGEVRLVNALRRSPRLWHRVGLHQDVLGATCTSAVLARRNHTALLTSNRWLSSGRRSPVLQRNCGRSSFASGDSRHHQHEHDPLGRDWRCVPYLHYNISDC